MSQPSSPTTASVPSPPPPALRRHSLGRTSTLTSLSPVSVHSDHIPRFSSSTPSLSTSGTNPPRKAGTNSLVGKKTLKPWRVPPMGKMQVILKGLQLNVGIKRPYVIIRLGGQQYQTTVSESPEGNWNEGFDFRVSYHTQLFGTIQLDLYDAYMLLPDRHVGRAEISIKHFEGLPEVFTSYYEIWERHLSESRISTVERKSVLSSSIGAIKVCVRYRFQRVSELSKDEKLLHSPASLLSSRRQQNNVSDEIPDDDAELESEFQKNLLEERSEHQGFRKLEEGDVRQRQIDNARKGKSTAEPWDGDVYDSEDEEEDELLLNNSILDMIGSWTVSKETNRVLKTIVRLATAFGQGFELSHLQLLTGFTLLEKFYEKLPREHTGDYVTNLAEIEEATYFWKFSIAAYGWRGLNFIGRGNGVFVDAIRQNSDALSVIEFLALPKEDLLAYEFRSGGVFHPSYYIVRDRTTNSIVLSIRGTMSAFDTLTDLACEYQPWKGGLVHSGFKIAAKWFMTHVVPQLITYVNEHDTKALYIVGHSLGAGAASILTMMLLDHMQEFKKGEDFLLKCYCFAAPCSVSLDLSLRYRDTIESYVYGDDVVSQLSYGSMVDVKVIMLAAVEAANQLGTSKLILGYNPDDEAWAKAFNHIRECRRHLSSAPSPNPKLYVAGKLYQFWCDPTPENPRHVAIERSTPRVCEEVIVARRGLTDHLPHLYNDALMRAREGMMLRDTSREECNGTNVDADVDRLGVD
ncbi:uncharacterized protein VTP21DRAFT_2719 [Calcarisporiella thermophila]|uniref:uncharacterized protein n=1 Tax=Calcarisporiella thermophila TaxID=911321 RepID=UPI0037448C22